MRFSQRITNIFWRKKRFIFTACIERQNPHIYNIHKHSNQDLEILNILTQKEKNFEILCASAVQIYEPNLQSEQAIKDFWSSVNKNNSSII
jgi:hypothetical protein